MINDAFSFKRPFVIGDTTWQEICELKYDSCKRYNDTINPWYSISCYRQLSMEAFQKINASWITYNTLCVSQKWGDKVSYSEGADNLQEAYMKVSSYKLCPYGM